MYVNEKASSLSDIAEQMRQKQIQAGQQGTARGAVLGGGLAAAVNQIRDRPEMDREMERLEKACQHISGLVSQLEHRLSSVLVPRPENCTDGHGESAAGSALGQAIRGNVNQLDSAASRLIALMDSLAV